MSLSNTFFLFGEIITDQYCWNQNIREIARPNVSNLVDVCSVNGKSLAWPCQEKHTHFDHCRGRLSCKRWQSRHLGCFPLTPVEGLSPCRGRSVPLTPVGADARGDCDTGHGCLWMPIFCLFNESPYVGLWISRTPMLHLSWYLLFVSIPP